MLAFMLLTGCVVTVYGTVMGWVALTSDRKRDERYVMPMLGVACGGVVLVAVALWASGALTASPLGR
jgi:H+/Cl- antiporter ClcA